MTIASSISKAIFLGNGVATQFPFGFRVWDARQLKVLVVSQAGAESPASGWTVALTDTGGTVTYLHNGAPLPSGWKLVILRDMPFTQGVNLITGTRFDPQVIEDALDQATAERQQLLEAIGRAVKADAGSEQSPDALIADVRAASANAAAAASAAAASEAATEQHKNTAVAAAASSVAIEERLSALAGIAPATQSSVGYVQIGEGIDVTPEGIISVPPAPPGVLPGTVVMFAGTFGGEGNRYPIPTGGTGPDMGWQLCDGTDGTPDLRGRMVMGAGGTYAAGSTGGADTHTHTIAGSISATTLSTAQMPSHGHTVYGSSFVASATNRIAMSSYNAQEGSASTSSSGSSGSHTHTLAEASAASASNLPPYYALAYIIKR